MRNSERVLNSLAIHSRQPNYKFERLYRLLFNEQMYYAAYQRIYAKEGNIIEWNAVFFCSFAGQSG